MNVGELGVLARRRRLERRGSSGRGLGFGGPSTGASRRAARARPRCDARRGWQAACSAASCAAPAGGGRVHSERTRSGSITTGASCGSNGVGRLQTDTSEPGDVDRAAGARRAGADDRAGDRPRGGAARAVAGQHAAEPAAEVQQVLAVDPEIDEAQPGCVRGIPGFRIHVSDRSPTSAEGASPPLLCPTRGSRNRAPRRAAHQLTGRKRSRLPVCLQAVHGRSRFARRARTCSARSRSDRGAPRVDREHAPGDRAGVVTHEVHGERGHVVRVHERALRHRLRARGRCDRGSPRVIGVSVRPGAMTLTRMPRGASSRARLRATACTPAFAATYGSIPTPGRTAVDEPVASSTPPSGTRCGIAARNVSTHAGEVDREHAVPHVEVELGRSVVAGARIPAFVCTT